MAVLQFATIQEIMSLHYVKKQLYIEHKSQTDYYKKKSGIRMIPLDVEWNYFYRPLRSPSFLTLKWRALKASVLKKWGKRVGIFNCYRNRHDWHAKPFPCLIRNMETFPINETAEYKGAFISLEEECSRCHQTRYKGLAQWPEKRKPSLK